MGVSNKPRNPYLFDTYILNPYASFNNPLDIEFKDLGNLKTAAAARDYPALERRLHEIDHERRVAQTPVAKLRRRGEAILRSMGLRQNTDK